MKFGIFNSAILSASLLIASVLSAGIQKPPTNECFRDQTSSFTQKTKSEILRLCNAFYLHNKLKLVVVIVPSLENLSVEDYAAQEFGKFSEKDASFVDSGIVILLCFKEREIRIELGGIASARMSNSQAKEMIDQEFIPYFKQGKLESGVVKGVSSVVKWFDAH